LLKKISAKKLLIGGGVFLAAALVALYILGTGNGRESALEVLSDKVDLQIKDFHYTEVGNPDLTWEIDANSATYIKKDDVTLFENVKVRLLFSNGDTFVIKGKNGSLHTDTRDMDISGDVVALSGDGGCLETASLHYSHNGGDGMIRTKDPVRMTRPGTEVNGVGMNLSLKRRSVALLSGIRATVEGE
jgi:LPS export ABC transporter protein LptC